MRVSTSGARKAATAALLLGAVLVAGCDNLTARQATVVGAAGGAAAGLALADLLDADHDWKVISALAGAAAGTIVAQNQRTGKCLYARGDGTYYEAPCPRG